MSLVNIDRAAQDKAIRERGEVSPLVDAVARAICGSRSENGFECCRNAASSNKHRCPVDRGGFDDAAIEAIAAIDKIRNEPILRAEYGR